MDTKEINLDIGSGGPSGDDRFIGVDAFISADVKALMWALPYDNETVSSIYSAQALEHVPKDLVIPTLKEWRRVLKPGGRLQIQVPDLRWAALCWLSYPSTKWTMDILYGHQKHEGEFHKTGFTMEILKGYIEEAGGFTIEKINYFGATIDDALHKDPEKEIIIQRSINLEAHKD